MSKSRETAVKVIFAAMNLLKDNGGEMPGKQLVSEIEKKEHFSDWELEVYEKSGYIRWQSILQFFSIDCIKAGYLVKKNTIWYITPEGEKALKLGAKGFLDSANKKYKEWAEANKECIIEKQNEDDYIDVSKQITVDLQQLEDKAISGLKEYIRNKNPYEFQDMVAALLRAMNYHTPFIAPKGKDGGVDIVAYVDPLGASTPRIKVQVKHRPDDSIKVSEIRSLIGILKTGDIGLFVTSGTFSSDAKRESDSNDKHVKLLDIDAFIQLWKEYYFKMTDEDKNMLPLRHIAFISSNES